VTFQNQELAALEARLKRAEEALQARTGGGSSASASGSASSATGAAVQNSSAAQENGNNGGGSRNSPHRRSPLPKSFAPPTQEEEDSEDSDESEDSPTITTQARPPTAKAPSQPRILTREEARARGPIGGDDADDYEVIEKPSDTSVERDGKVKARRAP
jgi:hypothetical protein